MTDADEEMRYRQRFWVAFWSRYPASFRYARMNLVILLLRSHVLTSSRLDFVD